MRATSTLVIAAMLLASCGGGGSAPAPTPAPPPTSPGPAPTPTPGGLFTAPAQVALTAADVQRVIAQAAGEATAQGKPASIAVVDRVGNVLAFFVMNGADTTLRIIDPPRGGPRADFHLFPDLPAGAAAAGAIAKAITGAYLSSSGNAFSTRTASQIVQEHFPPSRAAVGLESGPLFGVQFSQLPCSDLNARFNGNSGPTAFIGPKRSPLGLAADSGGFPLYKNGVVVGGIGVMADGVYGADFEIQDVDKEAEEIIALAGTVGFDAPTEIRAERITVDGTQLRYSDATANDFRSNPAAPPAFASLPGSLQPVTAYYNAAAGVLAGTPYGSEASGYRAATAAEFNNRDAFVLTNGSGQSRFPIRAATDGGSVTQPLTEQEVRALLEEAFNILSRARAQIRRPLDSRMEATVSIVDTNGAVLGIVRSPDAPIFGTDVSLQKARTAMFFSNARAGALLRATPAATIFGRPFGTTTSVTVADFVDRSNAFFGDPGVLQGKFAITNRAVGNVARPYFPDGEVGRGPGAFSRPIESFSPFAVGLQSALIIGNVSQHVGALFGLNADTPMRCTNVPDTAPGQNPLQNGMQIFPGGEPIYRGGQLIGGIGVSGDGIDQDDMVGFLGLHNASQRVGIGNPDPAIRSDRIEVPVGSTRVRLRYVGCPFAPFVGSSDQNVCQGK
jgi:uncharacterized protein GlcG (DUF336 family)